MSVRSTRLLAFLAIAACAQPGMPPGGPPDDAPPAIVAVTPESGAVNVRGKSVLLRFDEVINERSTPLGGAGSSGGFGSTSGASTLASVVQLSPSDGRDQVVWRRHAIEIEPRGGFRPNTAYRVTILPGLSDLRGNRLVERQEFVFSTGASIPTGEIHGVFFDWVAARTMPMARIEVWREADTTFRWIARSDSSGRFVIRDLEPGSYRLRGWLDTDNDRRVGAREIREDTTIVLTDRAEADLYAFERDTIGPRIESIEVLDSTAIRIRFDRAVAAGFTPDSTTITLFASDSSQLALGPVVPSAQYDSLVAARRAAADTAVRDTTAVDTTARNVAAREPAVRDTASIALLPLPQRPIPVVLWVAPLDVPLPPGEYRLKVQGLPGLGGASRPSERVFTRRAPPPPPPPRDSTPPADPAATRPPGSPR